MAADRFTDVVAIFEFRGQYPTVPITEGVDYEALTAGDTDPMFVTMPIGKVNSTSANKRYYDEKFIRELEKQVILKRPVGLMGHLSDAQRPTEFPPEAVHWVGAVLENDMLWGKGYVPPGPVRDRVKRYKASGRPLATSIDAQASGEWDVDLGAMRMDGTSLSLNQIDFAPADRAGVSALAVVPGLSREMTEDQDTGESTMDKLDVIKEMTAEDAQYLPETVRTAILETVQAPAEVAQVTEIRELLGLTPEASVVDRIKEFIAAEAAQLQAKIDAHITELVTDGVKFETVRPIVTRLIRAENPETVEAVKECYDKVIADETITELLKSKVADAGPSHKGKTTQAAAPSAKYFVIPTDEGEGGN